MSLLDQANPNTPDSVAATIQNPFSVAVKNTQRQADFPNGFFIREILNGVEDYGNQILLNGNKMPFQPFAWEGEQRLSKNYYPGNPEPVVHIMGPKEGPVTIKGRFKDKKYKDPDLYGVSYQFVLLIDQVRKRGNLVHFGMRGQSGKWVRYGYIENCKWTMDKLSWIDYEVTFFVVGETKPVNNYFSAPTQDNPSAINNQMISAANNLKNSFGGAPTSMPLSISGLLNNITSSLASKLNTLTGFVSLVLNTAQSIEASAIRSLGLIKNLKTTIYGFQQQIGSITHAFSKNTPSGTAAIPASQALSTFLNIAYALELNATINTIQNYLSSMESQFKAISDTIPKARYKVVQGDTLQNISIKYYGVSDDWELIYTHNNLSSTVLVPGTILEIPKL